MSHVRLSCGDVPCKTVLWWCPVLLSDHLVMVSHVKQSGYDVPCVVMMSHVRLMMMSNVGPCGTGVTCQTVLWWCPMLDCLVMMSCVRLVMMSYVRLMMMSNVRLSGDDVPCQTGNDVPCQTDDDVWCQTVWWWCPISNCMVMVFHARLWWWCPSVRPFVDGGPLSHVGLLSDDVLHPTI